MWKRSGTIPGWRRREGGAGKERQGPCEAARADAGKGPGMPPGRPGAAPPAAPANRPIRHRPCSTLGGAVCCALTLDQGTCPSRHASFWGAGEQRLTTRIQPSSFRSLNTSGCRGLCFFRSGPMVRRRSAADARSTTRLGVANQPSTIGRVRQPMGCLMNDLPEGAPACPS